MWVAAPGSIHSWSQGYPGLLIYISQYNSLLYLGQFGFYHLPVRGSWLVQPIHFIHEDTKTQRRNEHCPRPPGSQLEKGLGPSSLHQWSCIFVTSLCSFLFSKTDYDFYMWMRILYEEETVERNFLELSQRRPEASLHSGKDYISMKVEYFSVVGESGKTVCKNQSLLPSLLPENLPTKYISSRLKIAFFRFFFSNSTLLGSNDILYPSFCRKEWPTPFSQTTGPQESLRSNVLGDRKCSNGCSESPDGEGKDTTRKERSSLS